jgi:ABC-type sugar transport system ATPase subunit
MAPRRIEVRGLSKSYPSVRALIDVDLDFEAGTVVGLVGKNGAGKSTLLKALAGIVQPDTGTIAIDGTEVHFAGAADSAAAGLAFLHQELNLVDQLSIAENVALGWGYPRRGGFFVDQRRLRRRTEELLAELGIDDVDVRKSPSSLSSAQQRLVMIARALWANASFVVLDEPTGSFTEEEVERLHGIIRGLRDRGVGVIYVSHRIDEVLAISERVVVMRDGRLAADMRAVDTHKKGVVAEISGVEGEVEVAAVAAPAVHDKAGPAGEPRAGEVLLRVTGLGSRALGVSDVSFELRAGEVLGIGGLVGSGRTELLRLLFGAERADGGEVEVRGHRVRRRSPSSMVEQSVAFLGEDRAKDGVFRQFSVRENMTIASLDRYRRGGLPSPSPRREAQAAADIVDRLDIKVGDVGAPIGTLSGGNQQKVLLGRWLVRGADVFIFDEPTVGIDVLGKGDFYGQIKSLTAEGRGVIVVSSEHSELVEVCDRVLVIREGRLVGELSGAEIGERAILDLCYGADQEPQAARRS